MIACDWRMDDSKEPLHLESFHLADLIEVNKIEELKASCVDVLD